MLIRASITLIPFLMVLACKKSYGARLCLFLTMLVFFIVDIIIMTYQIFTWLSITDYYTERNDSRSAAVAQRETFNSVIGLCVLLVIGSLIMFVYYRFARTGKESY